MISLMFSNSGSCMAALIFYTCVWIPYLQFKSLVSSLLVIVFPRSQSERGFPTTGVCLPAARFEDLKLSGGGDGDDDGAVCAVCLAEFDDGDVVSRIEKCRHVFHMDCIEKWMERDHFTCPLCRSFLFHNVVSSHAKCGDFAPHTDSHLVSSWLSF
ncbi:Clathrin adaptor complex small chain family protein [Hibiscus syriacus]|uniref:Clathrin adaptor complex small chain family protein n=1 Tax=Hibiscus syriacus TaxID=106335 RepID=A0A6A2XSA7_HIBSY|nr:RING-H2 finger protein ATL18-like [Hibiscus syriacus]KAE8672750.1 Clathrin adaptor complex small chain family protein [Hibiscus syriacus]